MPLRLSLGNAGKENLPDSLDVHPEGSKQASRTNSFEIENLLKTAEQVTGICRSPVETRKSSPTGSLLSAHSQALTPSRQLTDAEKLKKVILELVETERTYVKVGAAYNRPGTNRAGIYAEILILFPLHTGPDIRIDRDGQSFFFFCCFFFLFFFVFSYIRFLAARVNLRAAD
jgi:hypothetical protein